LIPEIEEISSITAKPSIEKAPWDALRFLSQSSKFINLPNPFAATISKKRVLPGDIIWSAGSKDNTFLFASLDDVVMGGASASTFDNQTGMWKGTVTTANNGGFVGIRSTSFKRTLDMSACKGFQVKVRGGQGRRFKGTVRDSTDFNGVCWSASFDTVKASTFGSVFPDRTQSIEVLFEKQIPTIFAKKIPGQVFNSDKVQGIQFAYSKFEYDGKLNPNFSTGDFSIQIIELKGC